VFGELFGAQTASVYQSPPSVYQLVYQYWSTGIPWNRRAYWPCTSVPVVFLKKPIKN